MKPLVRQGTADANAFPIISPWFRIPPACAALVVALAAAVILAAMAAAYAAALPQLAPGEARMGSLLLRDGERTVEAPRLATDIDITVSGPTSRARITQLFSKPTSEWVEAVYVNPLPEGGAVDTLKMVIGERIVVGEIKERKEAKAIYESAKRAGQKASLFEQERPNLFTNSVANIQYRSRRNRAGADRIPGAGAPLRQCLLAARAPGGGAPLCAGAGGAGGGSVRSRLGRGQ
jgi:Ca-activated chloride channel homolog